MSESTNLAMPYGLPDDVTNLTTHYNNLASKSEIVNNLDGTITVYIDDEDTYSTLNAMTKSLLYYIPLGGTAPDGTVLTKPAIAMKPWLWDTVSLSESNSGSFLIPKLIVFENIDSAKLTEAITLELDTNTRYASLDTSAKNTLAADFSDGNAKLLVTAETFVGRGEIELSGSYSGKRKTDIKFFDENNSIINTSDVIELFAIVGGTKIPGHPLVDAFSKPVMPDTAPVDGQTRIRITGSGFSGVTLVTVNSIDATDLRISVAGDKIYATLPALVEGTYDVEVSDSTGILNTYANALEYVSELEDCYRAVVSSYLMHLNDLNDSIDELISTGSLDASQKEIMRANADLIRDKYNLVFYECADNSGASMENPVLSDIISNFQPLCLDMKNQIKTKTA